MILWFQANPPVIVEPVQAKRTNMQNEMLSPMWESVFRKLIAIYSERKVIASGITLCRHGEQFYCYIHAETADLTTTKVLLLFDGSGNFLRSLDPGKFVEPKSESDPFAYDSTKLLFVKTVLFHPPLPKR